jgi:hypothetical protein
LGGGHEFGWRRLFELDQHVGGLDLDPLAAVKLHLCRRSGLGQYPTGHEFSGFIKQ